MRKYNSIVNIKEIQGNDAANVGAKALGLARMKQIGLKVPAGFCVRANAYREHIINSNITSQIINSLSQLENANPQTRKKTLTELRKAIIDAPLTNDLRQDIKNSYHKLSTEFVAVRSSATAEDLPGHSFAGQYETYLGINNPEDCIEAVKKCWASLWTERAYEYRQKNGFEHPAVNMAVIVQALVKADTSGIIFTADPVNGYKSRIIIEAVSGLGEALVSGMATPDRFIVRKRNLKIISRRIKNRKTEFFKDANKSNQTSNPCIDNGTAKKLAKSARKMEIKFSCPQDIEWAIYKNKIYFLQSRPITVIPLPKSWEERQFWSNANVGEIAPDLVTPITWSMMQVALDAIFKTTFGLLRVNRGNNPMADLVAGRVYFNINTIIGAIVGFIPLLHNPETDSLFGGEQGKMMELGLIDMQEEDIPDLGFSFVKIILGLPHAIYTIFAHRQKRGELFLENLRCTNDKLQNMNTSQMTEVELSKHVVTAIMNTFKSWNILYILTGIVAYANLKKICKKWLADDQSTLVNSLFAGLDDMDDAKAGLDLWQIALKAHEFAEVKTIILSGDDWQTTQETLTETDEGRDFIKSWDKFMAQHGHHCRGELELYNPRWVETPNYILFIVRNYIDSIAETDPLKDYNNQSRQRKHLVEQCERQLRNPIKRWIFNCLLRKAQQGSILRENWKNEAVRYIAILRKILLELAQRLNTKGRIESSDDIFFLKLEEIEPVTQNKADFDFKKIIVQRRAEYEKNKSVMPPKVVIGKFDPDNYTPDAVDTNAEELNGLAVSSGVVTGKARVILKADTEEQVLPGEILIAPFTDPGWTPYFIPAAAIVMDLGGLLSHGSIIAREYGIPAVVNVGQATKIIKTGQTIQVDADRGIVKIISE
ncbi:MAG: PEP/pyruvate-binding domain-containing protein [Planctomycetota bacterium]|jgi:pyruvate,water dikinase